MTDQTGNAAVDTAAPEPSFDSVAAALVDAQDAEAVATGQSEPPKPEEEGSPQGEPNEVVEGADAPAPEEAPTEAEDGEGQELPDTLEGLAEAIGESFEDFSQRRVPIVLDGQRQEVTLHEAIQGHQREADYSRKTAEVAEQRRTHEAAIEALASEKQQHYESMASLFEEIGKEVMGEPPSKTLLDENSPDYDPAKYTAQKEAFQERQGRFEEGQKKVRRGRQELAEKQAQAVAEYAAAETAAFRATNPEWADEAKFKVVQDGLVAELRARGYQEEQIKEFAPTMSRLDAGVLYDAMLYRKAKAAIGNSKEKPKPAFQKSGAAPQFPNAGKRRKLAASLDRLRKGDQSREAQTDAFRKFVG